LKPAGPADAAPIDRVLLVTRSARDLLRRRPHLIAAIAARHKALCLADDLDAVAEQAIAAAGGASERVGLTTSAANPFGAFALRRRLGRLIDAYAPHAVATFDLSTAALIGPIARARGVDRIATFLDELPGALFALADSARDAAPPRLGALEARQLERMLAATTDLCLSRPEDARLVPDLVGLRPETRLWTGAEAGVDLDALTPRPLPPARTPGFLVALDGLDPAVLDVLSEAAGRAFAGREARLRVVARSGIAPRGDAGPLDIAVGHYDLARELAGCHVYVDASSEGEAGLIAALALGRPVIARDGALGRQAIDEIVNGCLIQGAGAPALAAALTAMAARAPLLDAMGRASRLKAERRFDRRAVDRQSLAALGLAA
jgi:hypothetical protein